MSSTAVRWSWLLVLVVGAALFAVLHGVLVDTGNPNLVPAVIAIGAAVVPATFCVYVATHNRRERLAPLLIVLAAVVGGAVGMLTPARGALGDIGRNTERGDNLLQFNVSVGKTFTVTERLRLQVRAEAFNVLNTVNYDLPDGVLSSRNFGQPVTAFDSRQFQLAAKITF